MPTTTTGIATEFIQFTRASNATVTDSDGKVKWAPHNLLPNSQNLSGFIIEKGVQSLNFAVSPDGSTTALKFTEELTGVHSYYGQPFSVLASVNYTIAIFAKDVDRRYITIGHSDGTNGFYAAFDLVGNTKSACTAIGTGTPVSSQIQSFGNGWYLCSITGSHSVAGSKFITYNLATSLSPTVDAFGRESYASTSKAVLLWGISAYRSDLAMQANTSAYPMYNPTTPKNLLGYTEDFSNAYWIKGGFLAFGAGSTVNATIAPNGLPTADLMTPDTTVGLHRVVGPTATVLSGTPFRYTVYVKPNGYTKVAFREMATTGDYAAFSLTGAGSVLDKSASATATISALPDGWYLISTSIAAAATLIRYTIYVLDPSYTSGTVEVNWTPNGTSGVYLWGAQFSDSASLDSYVPVYGAAVTSAAYYGPRRDFDGATLACKGLLVEEQRANLLTYSSDFNNWSKVNTTVTPDQASAPDGTITADTVAATTTGTYRYVIQAPTLTTGRTYTLSTYFKTKTTQWVWLLGETSADAIAYFDIVNGVLGTVGAGLTASILPVGNGWFRCAITFTVTSATGVQQIGFGLSDNDSSSVVTAGKDVYAWGGQLEENASFATSYIPTGATTAGATRLADVASVSTQAFPYSSTEGTLVANGSVLSTAAANRGAFTLASAGGYISIGNNVSGLGATNADFYTLPAGTFLTASGAVTAGTPFKAAAVYKASDFALSANGAAVVTSSSGALPTAATDAYIGRIGSSSGYFNGHIRQITYLPRRISNAELVTRST